MRVIKFRAWHKVKKEMVYLREMDATCAEGAHIMFGFEEYGHQFYNELDMNQWELMQFTGLLDGLGKEIYEGDELMYLGTHQSSMVVIFKDGCFQGEGPFTTHPLQDYITAQDYQSLEIIGNIYQK